MIFVPETVGIDGFDGGFAISFVSLVIALTSGIFGLLYFAYARQLDNILRGVGVLAHWTYTQEYWMQYTKKEYEEENSEKKSLFLIVAAFALFFGVLFWGLDNEAGFYVFIVMLGLIGLILFVWRFTVWSNYRHNLNGVKEAYITKDAIYLNRRFITWHSFLTRFKGVTILQRKKVSFLVFQYTMYSRTGPQTYTTRVPIPPDQINFAIQIMQQINMENGVTNTAPPPTD